MSKPNKLRQVLDELKQQVNDGCFSEDELAELSVKLEEILVDFVAYEVLEQLNKGEMYEN